MIRGHGHWMWKTVSSSRLFMVVEVLTELTVLALASRPQLTGNSFGLLPDPTQCEPRSLWSIDPWELLAISPPDTIWIPSPPSINEHPSYCIPALRPHQSLVSPSSNVNSLSILSQL